VIQKHQREMERLIAEQEAAVRRLIDTQRATVRHCDAALERHNQLLATYRAKACASAAFRTRAATEGLDRLNVSEVFELLYLLGIPVQRSILEKQEANGFVLVGLSEDDMQSAFNIKTLGERWRLAGALRVSAPRKAVAPSHSFIFVFEISQCFIITLTPPLAPPPPPQHLHRLANRHGFVTLSTLEWDTARVCTWLAEQGLAPLQAAFRAQGINGEVLLTLQSSDLACLGVTTLGGKATFMAKLDVVKKQHYAGQVVGAGGAAAAGEMTENERLLVLEEVLLENLALAARMAAMRQREAAAAAPPHNFLCPITTELMEDPVVAMDGHTYEREAIATWFQMHDTSPLTRAVIPPTLVPNVNLRSQIASWGQ
jgi:hypothetical protein